MTLDDGDDRVERRDLTGFIAGALSGGALGLLTATTDAQPAIAVLAVLAGAAAGALLGRRVAARVSVDDWDPRASDRPFVGIHTSDDDNEEVPPLQSARLGA
jgi:hypothetical protein